MTRRPASADRPPVIVMHADSYVDTKEERPGYPRQEIYQVAQRTTTQEGVEAMSNRTAPDLSGEWHPTWCDRDAGGCGRHITPEDRHHDGPLVDFHRQGEGDFTFTCRRYAIGAPGTDFPVNRGLEIEVESEVYAGQRMTFHGNTDEIRDLADFLFTEADRLDAWAEEQDLAGDPE